MKSRFARYGNKGLIAVGLVFTSMLAAVAGAGLLPLPLLQQVVAEGGPIENMSVLFYGLAIVAVCRVRNASFGRPDAIAVTIILACCIARETSLRRRLIAAGENSFCCSPDVVWSLVLVLVLLLLGATLWLALHYRSLLWQGIRHRNPIAITLAALCCICVLSQVFDRLPSILIDLGYPIDTRERLLAVSIEEVLEMLLPVLVILAAYGETIRIPSANGTRARYPPRAS